MMYPAVTNYAATYEEQGTNERVYYGAGERCDASNVNESPSSGNAL